MKARTIHQRHKVPASLAYPMSVARRTPLDTSKPCQPWTGHVGDQGYGTLVVGSQTHYAHRLAYQLHVGPINRGQEIDHACHGAALRAGTCEGGPACRHRACIEPAHLDLVSSAENSRRGNHPLFAVARLQRCQRGHDLTVDANVYVRKDGRRRCRACKREGLRGWRASKR